MPSGLPNLGFQIPQVKAKSTSLKITDKVDKVNKFNIYITQLASTRACSMCDGNELDGSGL